jgi:hypothetical protein
MIPRKPGNLFFMRKLTLLLATALLFSLFLTSCRTHERCPAYGKAKAPVSNSVKS